MNEDSGLPRIIVSAGEPAGIGAELILALARGKLPMHLSCVCDPRLLGTLGSQLHQDVHIVEVESANDVPPHEAGILYVIPRHTRSPVTPGQLNSANARYVLECLDTAIAACMDHNADAMVTAPLQKSVINDAGIAFTGHTEYLAKKTAPDVQPIMLLACADLRVALATTHLPLRDVADKLTEASIHHAISVVDQAMRDQFAIAKPRIAVCGLTRTLGKAVISVARKSR